MTVSLAGTRKFTQEMVDIDNWGYKEKKEQRFVTEYINKILSRLGIIKVKRLGPYAKKAAHLLHLRTDFVFNLSKNNGTLNNLINELHPTSAICGIPKNSSKHFIEQTEKHDREFYSGYIGLYGLNDLLHLYVNLRCMKIHRNSLSLFVGGGITKESDPKEEWLETEIKSETLLSIIKML